MSGVSRSESYWVAETLKARQQRDELLEALQVLVSDFRAVGFEGASRAFQDARAAIARAKGVA